MPNFTAGTSFTDGVTNDVTAAKLNALVADAVPTSSLSLNSTTGTISNFTASTANITLGTIPTLTAGTTTSTAGVFTSGTVATLNSTTGVIPTLTSTTLITTGTGTAAAPAIVPTGDTNTGIFFPAADTIAFSEGGAEAMRIDSSGNVGIGTASPAYPLVVSSAASTQIQIRAGNSNASSILLGDTDSATIGRVQYDHGTDSMAIWTNSAEALRIDSSGNVIISGNKSLISNGAGGVASNTSIGSSALASNGTGELNTAIGANALTANTTGANNTASGANALYSNTTGFLNTASGEAALYSNTTGNRNTASGYRAGYGVGTNSNTTGSNNTFIGVESVGASATADNVITLGNGSIATLRCQVTSITALSDKRDKKDIENLSAGLDFVGKLRPVSFVWNTRDKAKVNIPDAGFIAQELLDVQEATGITIPNLVSQENPEKLEAAYGTLIPVLVQAIKELKAKVESLENKNK